MASIKGTQTEKNLLLSFAGESQARNRYTYFASKAKKEGYEQIAAVFAQIADQEKEHAELFFKLLEGGEVEINGAFPAGVIGSTQENLAAAAEGERYENTRLYPGFAAIAEQEGFTSIAALFGYIRAAEKVHEKRFRGLLERLEKGQVFRRDLPVLWHCRNCGYVHEGSEAPEMCPACAHGRSFFEVWGEQY